MNPNLLYSGHEVKNYEDWGDVGFTLVDLIVSARFHDWNFAAGFSVWDCAIKCGAF